MNELNKKPSLPSIQFLLQETTTDNSKRQYGHRSTKSVSSLPLDLQNLSLQGPEDVHVQESSFNTIPKTITPHPPYNGTPFTSNEKPPSWMLPNDRVNNNAPTSTATNNKRSRLGHGRSVSEFTLPMPFNPPPTSTAITPPPPPPPLPPTTSTFSNQLTTPSPRRHRRAVSANTVDFMLTPSPISFDRSQSNSPTNTALFDPIIPDTSQSTGEGRYVCPYCQKKFSRPSSLRIHTYSHTGEKPFVCTEPGCGRHFSVQSNMRRHLRVHRLGRNINEE